MDRVIISSRQLSELRAFSRRSLNLEQCRKLDQTTLRSLLLRGYLQRILNKIELTKRGIDTLHDFSNSALVLRKHESNLSSTVTNLLKLVRLSKKSAA